MNTGLHHGLAARVYHADPCLTPSLSSGLVRTLIKSTPAHARLQHPRLGGSSRDATDGMVWGGYFHGLIAGDVSDFEIGTYPNYMTKDAKAWRDSVRALGKEPLLSKDTDDINKAVAAVKANAGQGLTIDPCVKGEAEVTAIWQEDGVWCRARFDRLVRDANADIWDWKTTGVGLSDDDLLRTIVAHGYHIQAAWYLRGLLAVAPEYRGRASFIFCFVETDEPYSVRRVCLDPAWLHFANRKINAAVDRWRQCLALDAWPSYAAETLQIEMPAWVDRDADDCAEIITSNAA